ncbi:MAG: hypothetical protein JNM86_00725 [Phycisphaerae bacterium]|nr:hypothetical protein [Phycisphaerae bacterium]
MKQSGFAIWGIPIYSDPEPADFIYHWLRCSWPAILPGKLIDQNGETSGFYICSAVAIGYPQQIAKSKRIFRPLRVEVESTMDMMARGISEDSALQPESVYSTVPIKATIGLSFDIIGQPGRLCVSRVLVCPFSREREEYVRNYGGRVKPYICDLQDENCFFQYKRD